MTDRLLEGALDALKRHGADDGCIEVFRVPGAFEIPLAAKLLAKRKDVDGGDLSRRGDKGRHAPLPLRGF